MRIHRECGVRHHGRTTDPAGMHEPFKRPEPGGPWPKTWRKELGRAFAAIFSETNPDGQSQDCPKA
jgi:hypothetical protein